eukprot:605799-Prorocentrum_lima.AAC.1
MRRERLLASSSDTADATRGPKVPRTSLGSHTQRARRPGPARTSSPRTGRPAYPPLQPSQPLSAASRRLRRTAPPGPTAFLKEL